ncbi:MAG: hypothetical protein LBG21_03460 [Campylobacteraceae bacterium]|jgi:hypothetical protein|nr:hypothetical protein [Campylobacteraceae bacterium]
MKFFKYTLWVVLFVYIVILFLPKENFYFLLEQKLFEHKIVFGNETLKDFGGVLTVSNSRIIRNNEEIGQVEKIKILPFILYNEINVSGLHILKKSLTSYIPGEIDEISLKLTPFYPTRVWIKLNGSFGSIHGNYNIRSKKVRLVLEPQGDFRQKYPLIYRSFKDIEGELTYESSF